MSTVNLANNDQNNSKASASAVSGPLTATVRHVAPSHAYVKIDGDNALYSLSSHHLVFGRSVRADTFLRPGDRITVYKMDEGGIKHIWPPVSMICGTSDPMTFNETFWDALEGKRFNSRVTAVSGFGIFVSTPWHAEALVHVSNLAKTSLGESALTGVTPDEVEDWLKETLPPGTPVVLTLFKKVPTEKRIQGSFVDLLPAGTVMDYRTIASDQKEFPAECRSTAQDEAVKDSSPQSDDDVSHRKSSLTSYMFNFVKKIVGA